MPNGSRQPAISVTGLRKAFGEKTVIDGISFEVDFGTVFSMLGPNGAGKTTIVNILTTLISADGGEAFVAGSSVAKQPAAVRAAIGVTGQFSAVDPLLTGQENLEMMGRLCHLPRAELGRRTEELLARFDLVAAAGKPVRTYSGGMTRRLDLAMSLIGEPRILFLDEPTTGLDPVGRRSMWEIIHDLAAKGTAVFLTTQYLDEADHLADHIALLDGGKVVAEGTPDELKRRVPGGYILMRFADAANLEAAVRSLHVTPADYANLELQIPSDGSVGSLRSLLSHLDESVTVDALSIHSPDLDDVFFTLTGGNRPVGSANDTKATTS
jgi:ABC-2 type transport system ATP-binding protein